MRAVSACTCVGRWFFPPSPVAAFSDSPPTRAHAFRAARLPVERTPRRVNTTTQRKEPMQTPQSMTPREQHRSRAQRRWRTAIARVLTSLADYRLALRAAAIRAGSPRSGRRLRRLARRGRANTRRLERIAGAHGPTGEPWVTSTTSHAVLGPVEEASEVAVLGSCLRANRRVYITAERALDARPPEPISEKLEALKNQAMDDAGILNARIGELSVVAGSGEAHRG